MKSEDVIELIRYFTNEVNQIRQDYKLFNKKEDVFIDLFAIRLSDIEEKIGKLTKEFSRNDHSYIKSINLMNENLKRLDLEIKNNNENITNILNDFLNNL